MGRGDRRTRRGKIFSGSFGNARPRKKKDVIVESKKPVKATVAKAPVKKKPKAA